MGCIWKIVLRILLLDAAFKLEMEEMGLMVRLDQQVLTVLQELPEARVLLTMNVQEQAVEAVVLAVEPVEVLLWLEERTPVVVP